MVLHRVPSTKTQLGTGSIFDQGFRSTFSLSVVWVIIFIVTSFVSSFIGEEPTWHEMEISTDCSHAEKKGMGKKTCPCKEPPQLKALLLKTQNVIEYLFVSHTARFLSDNDST